MSFCPIDNNEDLLKVYKYVRTALEKQIVENKPIDPKAIAKKLYDSVLARTKDQAKALSYAHLVPGLVRQAYGASQKVSDYFLDTNYSVDDAARLERSWRESPLEKVAEYLDLNKDMAEVVDSAKQVVATQTQIESSNKQNAIAWIPVRDYALPETLLATTGQEAQTDRDNRIPENNIKDPEMAMYYSVQRALVSNPNYPGIKGQAHLTMMTMSRLPINKLYPKTQRETEANVDLAKGYDKVFIQTVTDADGNIIYFDQTGKVTTEDKGMPVYFPVRLSLEQVQEPGSDAKAQQLKEEEAYLKEMLDYIKSNPESNQIISSINGGGMGFLDSSKELKPLSELSKSLYPTIEFRVDESGAPFMRVPRYQQDVAIVMNNFPEDVARNIARLLLNKVMRNGQEMTIAQKANVLFPYLSPNTEAGFGFNAKTKEYFLNGKPITQSTEEEIVKALTETKNSNGNIVPSRYVFKNTDRKVNKFTLKQSGEGYTITDSYVPYSQFVTENASVGKKIVDGDFTPFNSYLNFLPGGKFIATTLGVKPTVPELSTALVDLEELSIDELKNVAKQLRQKAVDARAAEKAGKTVLGGSGMVEADYQAVKQYIADLESQKAQENITNSDIQNSPKSAKDIIDNIADNLNDPDIFNMLDTQKKRNLAATREQLNQAIPWYMSITLPDGRKLSDVIPLKLAFNAVNMTSDGVATWTKSGITLWKGADTSDLYHEAWHGFSQVFLTNAQREELYNQVRKKKGSFSDYMGNSIKYSEATKLQAEEWLAEQFREHMLRGGKGQYEKSKKSVISKIFDAIYTALQHLFGGSSARETLSDAKADKNISDMFEKLRVGDLSTPNFEIEASFSEGLNKIKATKSSDPVQNLSNAESHLVFATVDSIMSDAVDELNKRAQSAGKANAPYTLGILVDPKTRKVTYDYVKKMLEDKLDKLNERASKVKNVPAQLKKKIDLLTWMLNNFGESAYAENGLGVIGQYEKSKFSAYTEESDQQDLTTRSEYADKAGNEIAAINLADPKLLSVLASIHKYESQKDFTADNPVLNDLGFAELESKIKVFNELSNLTEGSKNALEVYETLKKLEDSNPIVKQFLNKVGSPLGVKTELENSMWGSIEKIFTMPRVNVVNLDVVLEREKVTEKDQAGNEVVKKTKKISKVTFMPGEASRETSKVYGKMQSEFSSNETEYIKRNPRTGRNYIDIDAVVAEFYPNRTSTNFDFLKAIGITMPDVDSVRNGLVDPATGYPKMIKGLAQKLNAIRLYNKAMIEQGRSKDVIVLENVNDIFSDLSTADSKKLGFNIDASGTVKKELGKFYLRWTGDFSNSTVTTTMGKTKYERSNPNTITKMADSLNDGSTFQDVVQDEDVVQNTTNGGISRMNHLSTERNSWSKVSLLLDELYDMKSADKLRRVTTDPNTNKIVVARVNILDMDGTKIREEDFELAGIKSSISDPTTKFLQDFYMNLVYGTSEAVRHAGKSSTFMYQIVRARDGVKSQSKHYFDPTEFRADNNGVSTGRGKVISAMRGYLAAEFERVHKARTEESAKDKLLYRKSGKIVSLADTGSKFQMFDDILTSDQKEELLKLQDKDITTVEQFLEHLDSNVDLLNNIDTQLNAYLDKLVNDSVKLLEASGAMDSPYLFREISKKVMLQGEKQSEVDKEDIKRALIEAFTFNQYVHNVETGIVFYGDPALYNHNKEEFHKRNAGIGSAGEIPRTGVDFQNFVNNKRGSYSKSKWYTGQPVEQRAYDGTFRSAILADKVTKSEYLKEYTDAAIAAETARLKSLNASAEKIANAEKVIRQRFDEAYGAMKEGDAQGWITLDSYRLLMKSLNKWDTNVHEKLYNKILAGEDVSAADVAKFFPVKKMQYWGPLATEGLPAYAFHKFSLMPLVPTVIKGTKLEQLHNKMVEQQIDYSVFESGSKITSIGTEGKFDNFIDNETRQIAINDPEYKFTPNVVFADYMKDQTEIAPEYKGKVTFSTQLRKLVEEGIIENGVPVDFKPEITNKEARIEAWSKVKDKESESDLWKKVKTYESKLALLTAKLKQQLVVEAGWKDENVPDLKKLIEFVETQLSRQEITDNELEFINDLKNSPSVNFDLSSYRGQIEKLLTAVVNKRLIRQKVNGEALIQVSGAGFEAAGKFSNATESDLEKYGTNDLPFYKQDATGTKAMKVKVALQGQFKKLLNLKEVIELSESEGISRRDALNKLIKEESWLAENRKMITMMGVRIPVQGLNSMEFMEVYEFLPEEAGNIIIPPAEIVAKSGSDFDIDKMTIQMPNISQKVSKAKLTDKFLSGLQSSNPTLDFSRQNVDIILDAAEGTDGVYSLTPEDRQILEILESNTTFDVSLPTDDVSIKGLENSLMYAAIDLISDPANFVSLITPNGTDIAQPLSKDLGKLTREYSSRNRFASKEEGFSATRIYEPVYNIYKLDYNAVGKAALGLGAVDNTYNTIFNRIGAYMSNVTQISSTEGETKKERNPYYLNNRILMPHNKINGKISLSHLYDVNNENKISDIFSQLINGWVDVEKDEWIFDLQGNKELAPILLLLVQSGVSLKQAALFVSQPMVREYVKDSKLRRGPFAPLINRETEENQHAVDARNNILFYDEKFGFNWDALEMIGEKSFTGKPEKWKIFNKISERLTGANESMFTEEALKNNIVNFNNSKEYTQQDREAFMHFLELEQMSKGLTEIKLAMNYDTTRSGSLYEARAKLEKEVKASKERGFDAEVFKSIIENSPIGSFKVQEFMLQLWEPFFPITSSEAMNEYLKEENIGRYIARGTSFAGDEEGAVEAFRSQIIPFLFQNDYYSFKIGKVYRGREIDGDFAMKKAEFLRRGAMEQDGVIYYDPTTVNNAFDNQDYSASAAGFYGYYAKNNVAPLQPNIFSDFNKEKGKELYQRFLLERESLRGSVHYDFNNVVKTKEYKRILSNMKDLYRSYNKDLFKAEMEMNENTPDETRQEIQSKVKDADATAAVWAYETYLKNAAMDNMNLPKYLFYGANSYADQFMNIKKSFPSLSKYYPIMEALDKNTSNDKIPVINLVLRDSRLTPEQKTLYAENIAELSDASTIQEKFANISTDDAENIAKFFSRFSTYSYIQGATTPKSTFNLMSIANASEIGKMLTPSINNFISLMDRVSGMEVNDTSIQELILDSYLKAFKASNSNKKTTANKRFKIFDDPNFKFYANPEMSDKAVNEFVTTITKAATPVTVQQAQPTAQPTAKDFSKKNIFTVKPIQAADKKATLKASIATQYIGFGEGIAGSSTETYRKQAGMFANTGNYSKDDVIFVSIGGKRGTEEQQKTQQDRTIAEAIKAVESGATILTDNKAYTDASSYNTGEKRLYDAMQKAGYSYSEITVDDQIIGTWTKTATQQAKADTTVNQQVSSTPVAAPTTVLTMGKQQRTGVATFTIPGVKAETDAVAAVEAKTFGQANIDAIIAANPNTVFVGAGIAIKPGATSRNTTNYKASNTTVAQVGPASYGSIPYKYLPNVYKKDGTLIADSIMSDETYDQNIQVLEDAIQKIVENIGDKDVVFDANGYGQELLGRDPLNPNSMVLDKASAPKTFVYLSKRLYEEFGFINPNSLGSNTIVNAVQTNQRVNELELFNTLKNEALSCSI